MVLELPLYQAIAAIVYSESGDSLVALRWLNIFTSLLCSGMLFLIAKRLVSVSCALLACGLYMASPLFINFMGSIMLDPLGVFLALVGFLFLHLMLYEEQLKITLTLIIGITLMSVAILLAMIKPLYLFPCVILSMVYFVEHYSRLKELRRKLLLLTLLFAPAIFAMIIWQVQAAHINKSYGIDLNPAAHLGMSALFNIRWYRDVGLRVLWQSSGGAGVFAMGAWALCLISIWKAKSLVGLLLPIVTLVTVAGYLILFANINFPHNYYFLLPLPFLCLAAAYGLENSIPSFFRNRGVAELKSRAIGRLLCVCAIVFSLVLTWSNRIFPQIESMVKLETLGKGKFEYQSFSIVFVDNAIGTGRAPWPSPAAMTALGLRGFGLVTNNAEEAKKLWKEYSPKITNLTYVVFYGMEPVAEIIPPGFKQVVADKKNMLWAFATE